MEYSTSYLALIGRRQDNFNFGQGVDQCVVEDWNITIYIVPREHLFKIFLVILKRMLQNY